MSNTDLIKQKGKRSYDISQNQLYLSKCFEYKCVRGLGTIVMVFNAAFNNISAISWGSVILVEETGVPGENPGPVVSH